MDWLKAAVGICCTLMLVNFHCAVASDGTAAVQVDVRTAQSLFTRAGRVGACDSMLIPFQHAGRPTLYMESGGVTLPMLFDTGTFTCIFIDDGAFLNPGFSVLTNSAAAAGVDGKLAGAAWDGQLEYGTLQLLQLGGVRLRDVPFRIFAEAGSSQRDYAGAVSPLLFLDYIIELDNTACMITLHDSTDWYPEQKMAVVPFITLPRGSFIKLSLAGAPQWFHFDTGFSGTLGILPPVIESHPDWFSEGQGEPVAYEAWDREITCSPLTIKELAIEPYGAYAWASQLQHTFNNVEGVVYPRDYSDVSGLQVAGIVGSGFLSRFTYIIDYRKSRVYFELP